MNNTYPHERKNIPRVSSIISLLSKPFLYKWNNAMGLKGINTTKYISETANIGTLIHEAIEHHMMFKNKLKLDDVLFGLYDNIQADILYGFNKYIDSKVNKNIKEAQCERAFTCDRFGGTIDVYCKYKDDYTLLDIKTSNQVSLSHKIQLAAYMWLLEINKIECKRFGILLIPIRDKKKAKFYEYSIDEMIFYRKMFESLLSIYETQEELKLWRKKK